MPNDWNEPRSINDISIVVRMMIIGDATTWSIILMALEVALV
jgi:hypothetical protein